MGAMLPLFTLSSLALGEPAAIAALAVTVYSLGRLAGAAWGGVFAQRAGVAPATLIAIAVLGLGAVTASQAGTVVVFVIALLLIGAGHGAWHVARQAQVDVMVPYAVRARALATLAGVWRIGNFVGPFAGAAVIAVWGLEAGYLLASASAGLAVALTAVVAPRSLYIARSSRQRVDVLAILKPHARVLRTLGLGVLLLGAARQARVVVIPLWAEQAGLTEAQTSLIFGLSTAIDMVMFVPAGGVMDRWGRRWTAIPSALALGIGMALLPLTHSQWWIAVAAVLIGIGNGWGSGVLMTLGVDAAPADGRAVFIGVWTNLQDIGGMLAPALVSLGALASVPVGIWAASATGFGGAAALWAWVPRHHSGKGE